MWLMTGLTQKTGIKYPIIQAPMAGGATTPELVAAVSNAGALGSLGAGYMTPDAIREAICNIRKLTNKPFSVNLFIPEVHEASAIQLQQACDDINEACLELNIRVESVTTPYVPDFNEQLKVVIEEKVPVFSFTFGLLHSNDVLELKKNNTLLMGTASTLAEALALEKSGIDIIVAQGSEAGGHRCTFLGPFEDALSGLVSLIPQLVDNLNIPVIAAGGIMDARGIVASKVLGASGVQMGTAFLSCKEAGISTLYKKTLLAQKQDNTVLTSAFSGKLARGIRNKFTDIMLKATILDYPIQNALTRPMRSKAYELGDINFMSLWAGQSAYLCRDLSAGELIQAIVDEVTALI